MPLSWKGKVGLVFNAVPFLFSAPVSLLNALASQKGPQSPGEGDIVLNRAGN